MNDGQYAKERNNRRKNNCDGAPKDNMFMTLVTLLKISLDVELSQPSVCHYDPEREYQSPEAYHNDSDI